MATTTIRLPSDLKERIARAADRAGTTPHAFILDAISECVAEDERRDELDTEAERRYARIVATGEAIPWSEMRRYLEERVAGTSSERPASRKLGS